ncbi:unnamed protein product, partial [Phyllotreta striolata]
MDYFVRKKRKQNPRETANIFSLFTFAYTGSIFKKAFRKDLDEDDLYEVTGNFESSKLGDDLERRWDREQSQKKPKSIYRILFNMFFVRYIFLGIAEMSYKLTRSALEPRAFENLVSFFGEGQTKLTKNDALYNAGIIVLFNFTGTLFYNNLYISMISIGIEVRTCFSAFLYRKLFKLSPAALADISFGNIVTLITKDVQAFENGVYFLNDFWIGSVHTAFVCYLLYSRIGATTFAGIFVFLGVIPLQMYLGKILKKLRLKTCVKTDERLDQTQEALSMIRIIKMYTWEEYFMRKIDSTRKLEVNRMLAGIYVKLLVFTLSILVSNLGFYILVMAYIWMDQPADSAIIFYLMSNYGDIKLFFGYVLPYGITTGAEFMSATLRLNKVLKAEELPAIEAQNINNDKPKIELDDVTINIGKQEILKQINLKLQSGLTAITGPVGAGKSALLKTILHDFPITKGKVSIAGSLSYASQTPWLFASTIKQNILFGQEYDQKRYQEVIRVCALEYDLSLFDKGDETILSDNGLNLSKGQQARVNLARAVYRTSDIYLIDDSLTSLDGHVADFIYEECVRKFLKGKFCVLVTQTKRHLQEADYVVVVKNGRVDGVIEPRDSTNESVLRKKLEEVEKTLEEDAGIEEADDETRGLLETEQNAEKKQIFKDKLKTGSVSISNYKKYMSFGGGVWIMLLFCFVSGIYQFTSSYTEKLLSTWVDEQQKFLNIKSKIRAHEANKTFYDLFENASTILANLTEQLSVADEAQKRTFSWYNGMLGSSTCLQVFTTFVMFDFCRRASVRIHFHLMKNIFAAEMAFFDSHYIGVILNRLSQDLVNMDENLSEILNYTFEAIYYIFGSVILLVSVNYYFIIYIGIVSVLLSGLGRIYLPFGRSMKRLEVATRSPIINHLKSTFQGLTTIRACKADAILKKEYDKYYDVYTSSHFTLIVCQTAYGFFANVLSNILVTCVLCTFIFLDTDTSAGNVGLALSQIFSIGNIVNWVVRQYTDLESMMTSVERVFEYTDIKTENENGVVLYKWPEHGIIRYKNVKLAYNETDVVLNNLNFDVQSKQKIGIVGRTGAGKSSIISTIFRLYDIEGTISIDGVDTKTASLHHLRRNLAIIPQDPVLFTGTIRSNLDPFGLFSESDLWRALERANIKESIASLDEAVGDRTANFSLGQRQMICVARAILSRAKIIVLDEATANMDRESEAVVDDIIKEVFADCTVLTIAHRLRTVLDCDKVMVLDRGGIREFDEPATLLRDENSYFYKMVKKDD